MTWKNERICHRVSLSLAWVLAYGEIEAEEAGEVAETGETAEVGDARETGETGEAEGTNE
jgi:hypothetical protein